jgi:ADP-ribose pyrophosphatase YjhB (NUDIX family)
VRFVFCPRCGRRLDDRSACAHCGFVHYDDPALTAFGFVQDAGTLLWLRRAHEPCRMAWAAPGGFVSRREHPIETVVRETFEETALRIGVVGLVGIYQSDEAETGRDTIDIGYRCRLLGGTLRLSEEHVEAAWVDLDAPIQPAFRTEREALAAFRAGSSGSQFSPRVE